MISPECLYVNGSGENRTKFADFHPKDKNTAIFLYIIASVV
jgi:hypothetical protein